MSSASKPSYLCKVGDFCYFEVSSSGPYQIRRIDELLKTSAGNVEVRTTAYCRKRDLPSRLQEKVASFEKDNKEVPDLTLDPEDEDHDAETAADQSEESNTSDEELKQHLLSHREVYLTRMSENLPASLIRGKCVVYLLADFEGKDVYLRDEDVYFYTHTWDPNNKTLSREKGGDIRVGSGFQAEVPTTPSQKFEHEHIKSDDMEEDAPELLNGESKDHSSPVLLWEPGLMSDTDIDNFLMIVRSVGTFGRALDWNAAVKQPSLHLTAASASRDITIAVAMDTLHKSLYDLTKCLKVIVGDGPLICRDQMEMWTSTEAGLFEEALEKYGKDFEDIKQDLLPWKTMSQIIEYYYMWKTSDRFVQNKRVKAAEADGRLKQIAIQAYVQDDRLPTNEVDGPGPNKCCEGCLTTDSPKWHSWSGLGSTRSPDGFRLCKKCWDYWKKYGDLKRPLKGDKKLMLRQGPGIPQAAQQKNAVDLNSLHLMDRRLGYLLPPSQRATQMKNMMVGQMNPSRTYFRTRPAIYFIATQLMKQVRRVGEHIFKPKRAARQPFQWINSAPVKEHYQHADPTTVAKSKRSRYRRNTPMSQVSLKLLAITYPNFEGTYAIPAYLRAVSAAASAGEKQQSTSSALSSSPPYKRAKMDSGEGGYIPIKRTVNGRLVWPDAPEDFYYHPAPELKKERRKCISTHEMKKVGRRQSDVFAAVYNPSRLTHFLANFPTPPSTAIAVEPIVV